MLENIMIVGSGSAGLLAALTIKRQLPAVGVRIVRSPEISVIGVGESTTPNVPYHLFEFLKLDRRRFYAAAEPTWKLGVHFLWGPRPSFEYSFEPQLDVRVPQLPRANGFYCDDDFSNMSLGGALMSQGKAFARDAKTGGPVMGSGAALHLDNVKFVRTLEMFAREAGVEFIDAKIKGAERGAEGISAVVLEDGRKLTADFFIDASGFRSELLGRALEEPYVSFGSSLFNDRALVGNWDRTDEPILPYTIAETMDCGWCWRIDHEHIINRGYVYSSAAISDDAARAEFLAKNPKAKTWDHVVKFQSGRYQRAWVENVMAVGNAGGFVEPLESTALMAVCWQMLTFVEFVSYAGISPTVQKLFNRGWAATWDEIRNFLTLHFHANQRLNTPYWQHCNADADVSGLADVIDFYRENGPSGFNRYHLDRTGSQFGIEGFLVMFVGCRVPHRNPHTATSPELQIMNRRRAELHAAAQNGLNVKQALACIRHPAWRWGGEA